MKTKRIAALIVTILMGFVTISASQARPFGPQGKAGHMRPEFDGLRPFLQMDLTDTQRSQIRDIIIKYRDERADLRADIQKQRMDFTSLLQSESFNEEKAREAFRKDSAKREEMFILTAKMIMEIKAILTPEQLELLKEHKAIRMKRLSRRFGKAVEN